MNGFALLRDCAHGIARGFALFLTSRNGYLEQVSVPRLDITNRH